MADGVVIKINGDDSPFKSALNNAGKVAKSAMGVAVGAIAGVSTAIVAAGKKVVDFGSEFEQSAAKASTLFGNVAVDTDNLNKKILEMSSSTGVAATELNEGLYSALSAGVPVTEDMGAATEFLSSASKLAKAGFTSVDTAISATAKTLNAYGLETSEAERIQGILIQTQNKGITTVDELGASLAQVTPTAAAFGVSFEEVGASLATMTAQGTPTAQATTQLNSLIAELGKNGTVAATNLSKAAEGSKYAGMSFKEMMDSGATLDEVLGLLGNEAEKNGVSMVDMFSSIEAGKSALSIMSGEGETFKNNLSAMADTVGLVDDAYGKVTNTFQGQSARIKETLKNLGVSIYNENNSAIANVTGFVADLTAQLSSAYSENGLGGLVNCVGNVLNQVVTKVADYMPNIIDMAIDLIQTFIQGLLDNAETIATAAVGVINSLINGCITLLPMIIDLALKLIITLAQGIASQLPVLIPSIVDLVISVCDTLLDNLPLLLNAALDLIIGLANGLIAGIPSLITYIPQIIQGIVTGLLSDLPKIIECAITLIMALIQGLITAIPSIISALPTIITAIIAGFAKVDWGKVGIDIINGVINGIINSGKAMVDAVVRIAKQSLNAIKNFFGIASPSKLMRDVIGKQIPAGVAVGVDDNSDILDHSMQKMGHSATNAVQHSIDINSNNIAPQLFKMKRELFEALNISTPKTIRDIALQTSINSDTAKLSKAIASGMKNANISLTGNVTTQVDIDGKKLAENQTPFISKNVGNNVSVGKRGK